MTGTLFCEREDEGHVLKVLTCACTCTATYFHSACTVQSVV